jgi:hypothetical protein
VPPACVCGRGGARDDGLASRPGRSPRPRRPCSPPQNQPPAARHLVRQSARQRRLIYPRRRHRGPVRLVAERARTPRIPPCLTAQASRPHRAPVQQPGRHRPAGEARAWRHSAVPSLDVAADGSGPQGAHTLDACQERRQPAARAPVAADRGAVRARRACPLSIADTERAGARARLRGWPSLTTPDPTGGVPRAQRKP